MRTIRLALLTVLMAYSTSAAWGQYGLYGSPDPLRLPQPDATSAAGTPVAYPTTAMPATETVPGPAYSYPAQPAYRYAAPPQPPALATYPQYQAAAPQYQAGTQYYYPATVTRPPVRTAALDPTATCQPVPTPPGPVGPVPAPAPSLAPAPVPVPYVTPAPQSSGLMNRMLTEQSTAGCASGSGVYRGAVNQFDQGANAACADGSGLCGQGYFCPWYASVSALVMGRSDSRRLWTSYEDGNLPNQLMNSQFPLEWKWGGEVRVGHRFCWDCVPCAIEGTYWTTQSFTGANRHRRRRLREHDDGRRLHHVP